MSLRSPLAQQFIEVVQKGDEFGREPLSSSTARTYENALKRVESVMDKPFEEWRYEDMNALFDRLTAQGMRGTSIRGIGNILRVMYRWAAEGGMLAGPNPLRALPKVVGEVPSPVILSPQEANAFLDAMEQVMRDKRESASDLALRIPSMDERFVDKYLFLFKLSYYAGVPLQELISMRKDEVEKHGFWVTRTRGDKAFRRFVEIDRSLLGELRQYIAEHPATDFVFYGESGLAHEGAINRPLGTGHSYNMFNEAKRIVKARKELTPKSWAKAHANWQAAQAS